MEINKWKVFQVIQFVLFLVVSIVLFLRKVDGSGAENTTEVKWISFAIWLGFYLFLLALEYGIRFLVTIKKEKIKNMQNKQNNIEYKDESKTYITEGMSIGMCIGVALGSTVGIFMKNIPICICFGISIGMLVGMGIGATIKKNCNK